MGSWIDSLGPTVFRGSKRQRRIYGPLNANYGLEQFGNAFAERGGCSWKDIEELWPALPNEHGDYQVTTAQQYYPRPPAPHVQVIPQAPVPSEIDARYAEAFRRLERELEPNMARGPHVPPSVSAGRVATGSLEADRADAVAESLLASVLEEHVPAVRAKEGAGDTEMLRSIV